MTYVFHSPVGTFRIIPYQNRFQLWIGYDVVGVYPSAVAAADDVYVHVTGYDRWDDSTFEAPTDIFEWEVLR